LRHPGIHATIIRTKTHKLVKYHGLSEGELYDLEADKTESTNLWNHPQTKEIQYGLLERLCDRMAWTVDPMPLRPVPW
jgi:hypothetical protein